MGQTIAEKIVARAAGRASVAPGDTVAVTVDRSVILDTGFSLLGGMDGRRILRVADPDRVVVAFDHEVPTPNIAAARAHAMGRAFVAAFGIKRFHDVGRDGGISHALLVDFAHALPGSLLVCSDSHSCASGAMNCAARAVPFLDLLHAITTGRSWFRMGETIRYDLVGALAPGVSAKDLFLHIAGTYGGHVGQNVEYGGEALAGFGIEARRTLCAMGAELGADFVICEADARLETFCRARTDDRFVAVNPDPDATYSARRTIRLDQLTPLVARPDRVLQNTVPVSDVAGQRIDQAFIGSCANGGLDDLAEAARLLDGHRVAPGVRLIVTPATQAVFRAALAAGYVATLSEAGAIVTNATCGACAGMHLGVLGPDEVCITASTRNFKGRMGDASARIFMGSPATVAASAIAGVIADPRRIFA
ncbi:3-isopropylmalate dehydratase large subunit [Humitalea sp. 24SJ18S-53]|uniref:3-isopropylmalate dehydratase large subunit n=1 Tax=Humitalea sp. 24SJ18S-53 TaxID=3422307 RepID=UPI003D66E7EA